MILGSWPQTARAQSSRAATTDASAQRDTGSNQAGTAGLVLIGGWMLGSGILLWRGRRRLAQRAPSSSPDGASTTEAETEAPAQVGQR